MTTFQLLLFIISIAVFYTFFKQLFSGDHPKRGVDFEAKLADEQIGGISSPDKIFSKPTVHPSRVSELLDTADNSIKEQDYDEAKKALGSVLVIDNKSTDALRRMGYISIENENYEDAKKYYEQIIEIDTEDDMAYSSLANTLHKLDESEEAVRYHEKAIILDGEYAPHYFNYANTLYDMALNDRALEAYKKAYDLDDSIEEAENMIKKLSE